MDLDGEDTSNNLVVVAGGSEEAFDNEVFDREIVDEEMFKMVDERMLKKINKMVDDKGWID
ncbi:2933_t:CDS:2 [Cetraspora pellucida]|uniref:2933_t:CDS:1 n=1 Tax=Cetraspora pellucida TaxID=1433469 RepID=A0A9N9AI51_9GLOM|nr:2933_t:CDS:2 [Cetraspora pellucida]